MHKFLFYIAKNERGIENIEYGIFESENIIEYSISYEDINNMMPLIHILNDKLGILIDIYEDEVIKSEHISDALSISERYIIKEQNLEKKESVLKFITILKSAAEYNSPLQIWW